MPRLPPSLFRRAWTISPHLATLLPACRTLESAGNELRWIREYVRDSLASSLSSSSLEREAEEGKSAAGIGGGKRRRRGRSGLGHGICHSPGKVKSRIPHHNHNSSAFEENEKVKNLVARRGRGEPLQYVLGSQPFADLDILCEKGVLIPRHETEAWVVYLADLVFSSPSPSSHHGLVSLLGEKGPEDEETSLRIVDLCSGTGCISLSLYARGVEQEYGRRSRVGSGSGLEEKEKEKEREMRRCCYTRPRVYGFDIETRAVKLARKNVEHNARLLLNQQEKGLLASEQEDIRDAVDEFKRGITYRRADIFSDEWMRYLDADADADADDSFPSRKTRRLDILVSNPPYISQRGFDVDTRRSVRNHEPKLALVPSFSSSSSSSASLHTTTTSPTTAVLPSDILYHRLLTLCASPVLRPRIAVFEVGDMAQAVRVVEMAISLPQPSTSTSTSTLPDSSLDNSRTWHTIEIWRDWPDDGPSSTITIHDLQIPVRGTGDGRVVFLVSGV
ncbi:hypothetical protein F5Y17DRAFT_434908 [Xylariaceae sp. FL0594]|nr:hypothetical protein F5Y17DRAFT_434908 [Xylariaceae sp. FL0594]